MPDLTAKRTLVKSPPELWEELSEVERLAKHLGAFGEITITKLEPEHTVAWEGEHASGTVSIEPSGWGTKVTLRAELPERAGARARAGAGTRAGARGGGARGSCEEPPAALQQEPVPERGRARSRRARTGSGRGAAGRKAPTRLLGLAVPARAPAERGADRGASRRGGRARRRSRSPSPNRRPEPEPVAEEPEPEPEPDRPEPCPTAWTGPSRRRARSRACSRDPRRGARRARRRSSPPVLARLSARGRPVAPAARGGESPDAGDPPRVPSVRCRRGARAAGRSGASARRRPEAPNIVLVIVDTLRADHVSAYGGRARTPSIDALAARGTRFTRFYPEAMATSQPGARS